MARRRGADDPCLTPPGDSFCQQRRGRRERFDGCAFAPVERALSQTYFGRL